MFKKKTLAIVGKRNSKSHFHAKTTMRSMRWTKKLQHMLLVDFYKHVIEIVKDATTKSLSYVGA